MMEKMVPDPLSQQNTLDTLVERLMSDITKLPATSPDTFKALEQYRLSGFNEKTAPTAIPKELLEKLRTNLGPHWRAVFAKFDQAFPKKD